MTLLESASCRTVDKHFRKIVWRSLTQRKSECNLCVLL